MLVNFCLVSSTQEHGIQKVFENINFHKFLADAGVVDTNKDKISTENALPKHHRAGFFCKSERKI